MKDNTKMTRREAHEIYVRDGRRIKDEAGGAFVSLRHIDKVYPNGVQAVFDFNLDIQKHDFVALVGPSGCGKSTTLRMIAGLEEISAGQLYLDGVYSNFTPSKDRDIAMVFQSYALYPQLNVYDNIAFGLKIRKLDKQEIERRVFEAARILDLGKYLDRKPKELSGGQMQRVALGRALVRQAQLFLMDEPLSNLDAKLRVQMRSEIVRIHEEANATTIYVTHDQTEAMTMATKIVVMNRGFIQQIGAPMDIYNHPDNLFVATFIGTPPMNILEGRYKDGTVSAPGLPEIVLTAAARKAHDRFIADRLAEIKRRLDDLPTMSEEAIESFRLSLRAARNDLDKGTGAVKPIKINPISRLHAKLFHRKEVKEEAEDVRSVYRKELEEARDFYQAALSEEHAVKLGIRPECIALASSPRGRASAPFALESALVEILGSEFIIYGKLEGTNLTVKLQESVAAHEVRDYVIDIDRLHLYDVISGQSII